MFRALWTAKTGLDAQQTNVDVITNNLANVSTNGFKRVRPVFEDLLYQTLRQPGAQSSQQTQIPSGLQVGVGSHPVATVRIFQQGNLQQTDNQMDIAVNGNGFFAVTMPDGSTAYTRDGSFQLDANGQMVNANGYVLQPGITIPADALKVTIAGDGTVSVSQPGATAPTQIGAVQLVNFPNPSGLQARGENLYLETAASGTAQAGVPGTNGLGTLRQGYTETSNVNVAEELVNLIQAQRAFEINSRSIQTSDQMLQKLGQL